MAALVAGLLVAGVVAARTNPAVLGSSLFALLRSLELAVLAVVTALPPAVLLGVWLANFAGDGWLPRAARRAFDAASTVPGVAAGLAGWLLLSDGVGDRDGTFAMTLVLASLALPQLATAAERALRSVPRELVEASFAAGASHTATLTGVSFRWASRPFAAAAAVAFGRSLAECAPLLCLAPHPGSAEPLTVALWRAPDGPGAAVTAAVLAALAVAVTAPSRRARPEVRP